MPIYQYRCECGQIREKLRPVRECNDDLKAECLPELPLVMGGQKICTFKRILSPTPTTFRFNDRTGFKGLNKRTDKK